MPLRLLTLIHSVRHWFGSLANLTPEFHITLAAHQLAAGDAG